MKKVVQIVSLILLLSSYETLFSAMALSPMTPAAKLESIEKNLNPYAVLGFPAGSSPSLDEVKRAYKRLVLLYSPDKHGGCRVCTKVMQYINAAYKSITESHRVARGGEEVNLRVLVKEVWNNLFNFEERGYNEVSPARLDAVMALVDADITNLQQLGVPLPELMVKYLKYRSQIKDRIMQMISESAQERRNQALGEDLFNA